MEKYFRWKRREHEKHDTVSEHVAGYFHSHALLPPEMIKSLSLLAFEPLK